MRACSGGPEPWPWRRSARKPAPAGWCPQSVRWAGVLSRWLPLPPLHCHWEARPPAKLALKVGLLFTPRGPQNEEPGGPHLLSLLQTSLQSPSLSLGLWEMGMILVT